MISVRDSACVETNRVAGAKAVRRAIDKSSEPGVHGILTGMDALHGMVQIEGQAARPPKSDGGTLQRHGTAFGNVPSAVPVPLKPQTAATKTLTRGKAGQHLNSGECGK
ncbi:MAG: hypothetical protein F4X97_02945 [Boseongicola sp. SB0662_bin_57]|nr:hypothetical protein [Boseongicola sp. SB0662_bin_57]